MTNKASGRRRLNLIDFAATVVVLLAVAGFALARAGHAGVNKQIQGTPSIAIDVFVTGLKTEDLDIFKKGEPCAITVRNVPVSPPLTITNVVHNPKQVAFLSADGKKALSFPDPANPIAHDYLVTVSDRAEETQDGYVVHGQKIKIGNSIDLEGKRYRVQGVVVDLKVGQ